MAKFKLPRKEKKKLQKETRSLIEKYLFLQPRNVWTGKIPEDYDYTYCLLRDDIPEGWWKRFGIELCDDLKEVLEKYNYVDKFSFTQVKEKYGHICLYNSGEPDEWSDHEYAWELISEHTCNECGDFPVPIRHDNYILPWCDRCWKNHWLLNGGISEEDFQEVYESNTPKDWDGRMPEYLTYEKYSQNTRETVYVDMKPYYKKIGWNFTENDLILKSEIDEYVNKKQEAMERLQEENKNYLSDTEAALKAQSKAFFD